MKKKEGNEYRKNERRRQVEDSYAEDKGQILIREGHNPPEGRAWHQVKNLGRKRKRGGKTKYKLKMIKVGGTTAVNVDGVRIERTHGSSEVDFVRG